jgi:hypothetical protein
MGTNLQGTEGAPISVTFSLSSPGARSVSVAIFFNQWSDQLPLPKKVTGDESQSKDHLMVREFVQLNQVAPGQWSCEISLAPGWHEYLFLVDGTWVMDPDAPETCPDYVGGFNAARMVGPVGEPSLAIGRAIKPRLLAKITAPNKPPQANVSPVRPKSVNERKRDDRSA